MKKIIYSVLLIIISLGCFGQSAMTNNGNLRLHSGANLSIFGDLINNNTSIDNTGDLYFLGSSLQTLSGTHPFNAKNITVDNNNNLKLDNELQVTSSLSFTNGIILSDRADAATEFLHFLNGATYTGESDSRYVNGVVRKTGSQSFMFPVGDDNQIQPIGISSPSNGGSHFTAYYTEDDPHTNGFSRLSKEATIHHVSACEFWILNRTGGSENVQVTLNYDSHSCGITDLTELLVTRWDGSEWKNHGNGGTTGNVTAGTLTTNGLVTSFSPFTLASSTSNNPLPVELLSFEIAQTNNNALLTWITASELNNDYFELEKSINTNDWFVINKQLGAGNSTEENIYEYQDRNLVNGTQYYRLKQVDFDGQFEYSDILSATFISNDLTVYPNPNSGTFTISGEQLNGATHLEIVNNTGKLVYSEELQQEIESKTISLPLARGTYQIRIGSNSEIEYYKFVVQ
ncbi:MAG: T9SS type A sorting domain-containing protein [Lishizhenia sp.]